MNNNFMIHLQNVLRIIIRCKESQYNFNRINNIRCHLTHKIKGLLFFFQFIKGEIERIEYNCVKQSINYKKIFYYFPIVIWEYYPMQIQVFLLLPQFFCFIYIFIQLSLLNRFQIL